MNDDQLLREVGSWLHDADPEPPDANEHVRQAMARAPQVRQRGRWWPLPVLGRPTGPLSIDQTSTAYQPSPIPATNGHTPTVLRRTQSMFSPVKAITAALVFAVGGAFLIAQPFDQQGGTAPGAATEAEEATAQDWTYFTWTSTDHGASVDNDGGTWRGRSTLEATDPRASGLLDVAWNATGGGPDDRGMSLWEFRLELTNEDGSWSGTGSIVGFTEGGDDGPGTGIEPYRLQGTGAYEGLSLFMVTTSRESDEEQWGMIVPSADVPQAPDAVSAG